MRTSQLAKADSPIHKKDISPLVLSGSLAVVLAFHFLTNFFWIQADYSFEGCDVLHHLNAQALFWYLGKWIQGLPVGWQDKLLLLYQVRSSHNPLWSPFIYYVACMANAVLGNGLIPVLLTSTLWFLLLIVSTCLLGCRLFSRREGLWAAVLVSLYPGLYGLSRKFGLDLPLSSMVTLGMYLLVRSQGFKRRGASVAFGVCLGIALAVKLQALIFFVGPLALAWRRIQRQTQYYLMQSHVAAAAARTVRWRRKHLLWAVLLGGVIGFLWWHPVLLGTGKIGLDVFRFSERYFSRAWMLFKTAPVYYAHSLPQSISLPLYLVGLPLAIITFFLERKRVMMLMCWFVIPLIFFALLPIYWDRFIFPCLPAFALLTARGITRPLRSHIIKAAVCIGVVQLFWFSCNFGWSAWQSWSHSPRDFRPQLRELVRGATIQESLPEFNCNQVMVISHLVFWGDEQVGLEYTLAHAYWGEQVNMIRPIAVEQGPLWMSTYLDKRIRLVEAAPRRQMPRFLLGFYWWQGMIHGYRERAAVSLPNFAWKLQVWERDNESGK